MALFILTTASSCDVPTGFIFCPIHVLDSDQELPEPYFRHRDENSKDHTTYFESLVVHDNSTDEIVWQITLDTSEEHSIPEDFYYGEELSDFIVDVEPVPLEKNHDYTIYVNSFLCDDHMVFLVDDEGLVVEQD